MARFLRSKLRGVGCTTSTVPVCSWGRAQWEMGWGVNVVGAVWDMGGLLSKRPSVTSLAFCAANSACRCLSSSSSSCRSMMRFASSTRRSTSRSISSFRFSSSSSTRLATSSSTLRAVSSSISFSSISCCRLQEREITNGRSNTLVIQHRQHESMGAPGLGWGWWCNGVGQSEHCGRPGRPFMTPCTIWWPRPAASWSTSPSSAQTALWNRTRSSLQPKDLQSPHLDPIEHLWDALERDNHPRWQICSNCVMQRGSNLWLAGHTQESGWGVCVWACMYIHKDDESHLQ